MRLAVRRVAREKRRQAPEWSRIAFYLRRCLVNCIVVSDVFGCWQKARISEEPKLTSSTRPTDSDHRTLRREARLERIEQ